MSKKNRLNKVKNFGFNTTQIGQSTYLGAKKNNPKEVQKNLSNYITPVQLTRLRTDISMWRDAVAEMERAYYPFRVKAQRIFIDTILNGHVYSLMQKRKDLTLMRKFKIVNNKGEEATDLSQWFSSQNWLYDFIEYSLDTIFFGYSLISLGDVVNGNIEEVKIIPRWFVSPDRHEVGSFIYATSGIDFREKPQSDWHIYVKTRSDNGATPCGYGLLYNIALYEIYLRNTLGYNADFVELYAMPYRVAKTTKQDELERAELERAVRDMGSAGYAIIDPMDDIQFLETNLGATGYQGYESLEDRCQKTISKIILGHSDVLDSTPGKLGSQQGGKGEATSPQQEALIHKQTRDARFIEPIINNELIPRLRNLGIINVPEGYFFQFENDSEQDEINAKENANNLMVAKIAQTMKSAGLQMDANYFQERTNIITTEMPSFPSTDNLVQNSDKVKNKLKQLYGI